MSFSAVFNKLNKVIVTVLLACVNGCLSYPDRDLVQSRVLNSRQITDENLNVKTMGEKNFKTKITNFLKIPAIILLRSSKVLISFNFLSTGK